MRETSDDGPMAHPTGQSSHARNRDVFFRVTPAELGNRDHIAPPEFYVDRREAITCLPSTCCIAPR